MQQFTIATMTKKTEKIKIDYKYTIQFKKAHQLQSCEINWSGIQINTYENETIK